MKPTVRLGVLPRLLKEILDTRIMVKKSLKKNKDNKVGSKVAVGSERRWRRGVNTVCSWCARAHGGAAQVLARMLDARQLGLKLIANVTYGYTSASFSGRMPCAEVADAIVQTGRDTLQRVRSERSRETGQGVRVGWGRA